MKPFYQALALSVLVGSAAAAATVWIVGRPPERPPARAPIAGEAELRGELAELRGALSGELSSLRSELRKTPVASPSPTQSSKPEPEPRLDDSAPTSVEDTYAIKVLELEARVQAEAADPVWSGATENAVTSALARGTVPGTRLREVKCTTTLCRATVDHDSPGAQKELATHIAAVPPFDYGVYYAPQEGENATVIFVMRPEG